MSFRWGASQANPAVGGGQANPAVITISNDEFDGQ